MAITILTDSTSDITPEEARSKGIELVTLRVYFGEESFRDNLDITHAQFYERLAQSKTLPTTSQPTPEDFLPYFEQAKANGDEMICILLAGGLSGTLQSALIAKDLCHYPNIHIVDSTQAVIGLRMLVDLACLLRSEGRSAAEIVAEVEQARSRVRLFALVDTLEYLHKGGRLPAAAAVAGTLLKVKPLVTLKDGAISVAGKGMGTKDAMKQLLKLAGDLNADPRLPIYYGYTKDSALCDQFRTLVDEAHHPARCEVCSIGAVIGAHVGPGVAAIGYLANE